MTCLLFLLLTVVLCALCLLFWAPIFWVIAREFARQDREFARQEREARQLGIKLP